MLACHRFPPDGIGGIERIVQALGQDLPRLGDSVTIVAGRFVPGDPLPATLRREPLGQGGMLYRLAGPLRGPGEIFDRSGRLEQLFMAALIETMPDVLHVFQLLRLSPDFLEIVARQRAPIVISLQDFYFACPLVTLQKPTGQICDGPNAGQECAQTCFAAEGALALQRWALRALYFRRLLDLADAIICPSRFVADFFIRRQGLRPEQVRVIPNGIARLPRPARARLSPRQRGRLRLAFLGAVVPHKGLHLLLSALGQAALPSIRLDLNGDNHHVPGYVEELRQRAKRIPGLDLHINGPYEPDSLPQLLQSVDCVVVPSVVPETFALVSREALAQGVPILVARSGGLLEAVSPGVNGLSYEPDQPAELAEHLRSIWEDGELLARLSRGAAESVVMYHPEHAQNMHDVYAEVLDTSRRQPDRKMPLLAEVGVLRQLLIQAGFG